MCKSGNGGGGVGLASLKSENCWTHTGGLTKAMTVPANKPLAGTQYLLPPTSAVSKLSDTSYPTLPQHSFLGRDMSVWFSFGSSSASMVPGPRSGWRSQGD